MTDYAFTAQSAGYAVQASTAALPKMSNVQLAIVGQYAKDTQNPPRELRQVSAPFSATVNAGDPGWNQVTWSDLKPLPPNILQNPVLYISTNGRSFIPLRSLSSAEYAASPNAPIVILGNVTQELAPPPTRGKRYYGKNSTFNRTNAPMWIVYGVLIALFVAWRLSKRGGGGK